MFFDGQCLESVNEQLKAQHVYFALGSMPSSAKKTLVFAMFRDVILKKARCPTVTISQLVGIIRHVKMPINNPNAHGASTSRGQHMVHHGPRK